MELTVRSAGAEKSCAMLTITDELQQLHTQKGEQPSLAFSSSLWPFVHLWAWETAQESFVQLSLLSAQGSVMRKRIYKLKRIETIFIGANITQSILTVS